MASLQPGTLLGSGKYRVIREINRGGTAIVYECETLPSGMPHVALKVMSVKEGKASTPIKGVKKEIQYTASVQHENVVQLIDFFAEENHVVIVWELISGPDLLDLLNECGGRLRERDAAGYFAQLLRGVTFIHERGLCHRDLKPENVMLDRATGRIKIIDFGLSKHAHSAVTLGVGTPDYMAPELLGNGSVATLYERHTGIYNAQAADIWALGVMLFLLVTGLYPFEDPSNPQNVVATLQNIMAGHIRTLPSHVSPTAAHLIRAMLARDPSERVTLSGIAAHPWVASGGAVRQLSVGGHAAAPRVPAHFGPPRDSREREGCATGPQAEASAPQAPKTPPPAAAPQAPATPPPASAQRRADSDARAPESPPEGVPGSRKGSLTSARAMHTSSSEESGSFSLSSRVDGADFARATVPAQGSIRCGVEESFTFNAARAPSACPTPRLQSSGRTGGGESGPGSLNVPRSPTFSARTGDRDAVLRLLPEPAAQRGEAAPSWGDAPQSEVPRGGIGGLCRLWFGSGNAMDVCGR